MCTVEVTCDKKSYFCLQAGQIQRCSIRFRMTHNMTHIRLSSKIWFNIRQLEFVISCTSSSQILSTLSPHFLLPSYNITTVVTKYVRYSVHFVNWLTHFSLIFFKTVFRILSLLLSFLHIIQNMQLTFQVRFLGVKNYLTKDKVSFIKYSTDDFSHNCKTW